MADRKNTRGLAAQDHNVTDHIVPESDLGQSRERSLQANQRLKQYAKKLFEAED